MYYVTYLSKPRTRFGISEEEMKAEYERNYDKRVTKVTHVSRAFNGYSKVTSELYNIFTKQIAEALKKEIYNKLKLNK